MSQFLVVPLQLLQDDPETYKRLLDDHFKPRVDPAPAGTPIAPAVSAFLEAHWEALRAFHRASWPKYGPGLVYIHDRLDEPATSDRADWAAAGEQPFPQTPIGGYAVVYAATSRLKHQPALADLVRRHASPTTALVHCRTAHLEQPASQDQPYVAVLAPKPGGASYAAERAASSADAAEGS